MKHFFKVGKIVQGRQEDLLRCLGPCFLPKSRNINNNIDFVRSSYWVLNNMTAVEGIFFDVQEKRKKKDTPQKNAAACPSLAF